MRQKGTFTNINDCKTACNAAAKSGDMNKIKSNCWCMDEVSTDAYQRLEH